MKVVSTFPLGHAAIYGERFLADCARSDIPLTLVCYEDFSTVREFGEKRVDGRHDRELMTFLWYCQVYREMSGDERAHHRSDYRFQVERFAWKAFAMTSPEIDPTDHDWLVWLDADVEIFAPPDWSALLNADADVVYLGRSEWNHSETGFVAFNLQRAGGDVLRLIRSIYRSYDIFDEQEWHDAWIFDVTCSRLGVIRHNLSPNAKGLDAWEASPLAVWSQHLKGNRKYGNKSKIIQNDQRNNICDPMGGYSGTKEGKQLRYFRDRETRAAERFEAMG